MESNRRFDSGHDRGAADDCPRCACPGTKQQRTRRGSAAGCRRKHNGSSRPAARKDGSTRGAIRPNRMHARAERHVPHRHTASQARPRAREDTERPVRHGRERPGVVSGQGGRLHRQAGAGPARTDARIRSSYSWRKFQRHARRQLDPPVSCGGRWWIQHWFSRCVARSGLSAR